MANNMNVNGVTPRFIELVETFKAQHNGNISNQSDYGQLCIFVQKNSLNITDKDRSYLEALRPKQNTTPPPVYGNMADPVSAFMSDEEEALQREMNMALGLDIYNDPGTEGYNIYE